MAGENKTVAIDEVLQRLLQHLDGYVSQMRSTKSQVDELMGRVGTGFQSEAGRLFCRKVEEWIMGYDTIMQKYQALHEATLGSSSALGRATQDGVAVAQSWTTSPGYDVGVATVLNG
ncbi:hypothetical protein AB0K51_26230 [Kitasatospora sp. NPDC049285]|uniref:hypothetical protein n=1 Tax=Kitasatospora sp. NPDC049285 TaxID=3157096 RepID=UPI003428F0C9